MFRLDQPLRKCQNCLYFRHLELIGHPTIGLRQPPKAKVDNPISCASKWPVLAPPQLAGFARPMTELSILFSGLDPSIQAGIESEFVASGNNKVGMHIQKALDVLDRCKDAFVEWRYNSVDQKAFRHGIYDAPVVVPVLREAIWKREPSLKSVLKMMDGEG